MKRSEIDDSIQDLLDGSIEEATLVALEQELRHNPKAQSRYVELVHMHSALELRASASQQLPNNVVPMDQVIQKQQRRSLKLAALAAAAVLLISFLGLQLIPLTQQTPLAFTTSPGTQFTLTHTDPETPTQELTLEPGSRLELKQGSIELTFASGVQSIIFAPADLTLHDEDTLAMTTGRGWFNVPPAAVGFQVLTKDLDIVDLGTEFGVLAGPHLDDEIHVFTGAVNATSRHSNKLSYTMKAGEARQVTRNGALTSIPVDPSFFPTQLPNSLPHLRWNFDQENPFQVTGSHPEVPSIHTSPHGNPTLVAGRKGGTALQLNGIDQFLETNWKGLSGLRPRTITAWIKLDPQTSYDNDAAIVGWGKRSQYFGKCTMNVSGPKKPRQLRLSLGNRHANTQFQVPTDQWVHLAIASNGTLDDQQRLHIDLYINGFKESHTTQRADREFEGTTIDQKGAVPLLIGSSVHRIQKNRALLKAQIDQITIYDGYLDPYQIEQLARQ
ncbi:LamG-like jellyroll fold domain-containing protein [Rubritalea tangerina]|uniref:LamG-like jellyroll fold domain-containing protein n=1 Tax=Rubritalea tangerina TaxID=430798 RepID=A0ABW4Z9D6_9BACT